MDNGYLQVPEPNAENIFIMVTVIPYKTITAVPKKFIPGNGKKASNEIINNNDIVE